MTIMALAGAVLLLGVETSLRSTIEAEDETIAAGLAEQLIDEIVGHPYSSPDFDDPYQYPLGPNSAESAGDGRSLFNDTDDYNGYVAHPAEDIWGMELGRGDGEGELRHPDFRLPPDRFARWRQEVSVYYVDDDSPWIPLTGSATSNTRCAEVRIQKQSRDGHWRTLATAKRVYTYVPPLN